MKNTLFFSLLAPLALVACQRNSSVSKGENRAVHLATWSNYISQEQIQEFEKKTGLKLEVSNYSSNEELLAKLQAGASGYDVAVPSDYMVFTMSKLGLLQKLDLSQIPNFKEIDPDLTKKYFDPQNLFSVPYDWGTTGIAVNRKLFKGDLSGWKDIFGNQSLNGKVSLLDDAREALGAAMKYHGKSLNSKNSGELESAKKTLMENKKTVKAFTSEPLSDLVNGEIAVAQAYSMDALQASQQTGGAVEYLIPSEGCTMFIDNLVIPYGAQNVEGAYQLINFMIDAHTNFVTASTIFAGPSNLKSRELLSNELKSNRGLFPSSTQLQKCEMMEDLGESLNQWDRAWTEVKASL